MKAQQIERNSETRRQIVEATYDALSKALGPWKNDDCGSAENAISMLASQRDDAQRKIKRAVNCLVCYAIADPVEIIENTLDILDPAWRKKEDAEGQGPTGEDLPHRSRS